MLNRFGQIIATKPLRQSSVTFLGALVTGILGLAFSVFMARSLGVFDFGIYSFTISVITLLATAADFGTNTGIVRFVGKEIVRDRKKVLVYMKLGLVIKIISWLVVLLIGLITSRFIAVHFFQKEELVLPIRFAFLSFGTLLLFSFATYSLQALQKFVWWAVLGILSNLLRILAAVAIFLSFYMTSYIGISLYVIFPFLGFLLGILLLPSFWKSRLNLAVLGEFLGYNKWVAVFTIIATATSRVDTFLITRFLTVSDVGIYAVATSLASIIPQFVFAIAVVAAPKLSGFGNHLEAIKYLKKLQLMVIGLAILGIVVGIPLAYVIVPLLYGSNYLASLSPLVLLIIAQAILLISVPIHTSVFYYFAYPKLFVYVESLHLIVVFIAGWFLIPVLGIGGGALAILIGNISNFLLPGVWVYYKFSKNR